MKWARFTVLATLTSIALWLMLEIVLRLFGYGMYIIYTPDPELIWVPRPNQVGRTVAGHKKITINSMGLRYSENMPASNPREHRIFVFGDSVTMGWGQDDTSHYSAVLERLLASSGSATRYRVISAGVNAYPTYLCVLRFERMLREGQQIDTAVLAYSFNTEYESLSDLGPRDIDKIRQRVRLKSVLRRSAVYNLVIEDWLRTAVYYRLRRHLMEGSWRTGNADSKETRDAYAASLQKMWTLSQQHRVRLVFLLLGSQGQRASDLSENQRAFVEFALQHGIPIVNVIDAVQNLDQTSLFMDHVHPTSAGHLLIAESLAEVLLHSTSEQRAAIGE